MLVWKVEIGQRLRHALVVKLDGGLEPYITQFLFYVGSLFQRRLLVLLGVCGFLQGHGRSKFVSWIFDIRFLKKYAVLRFRCLRSVFASVELNNVCLNYDFLDLIRFAYRLLIWLGIVCVDNMIIVLFPPILKCSKLIHCLCK